jgi:hypothetical protein
MLQHQMPIKICPSKEAFSKQSFDKQNWIYYAGSVRLMILIFGFLDLRQISKIKSKAIPVTAHGGL